MTAIKHLAVAGAALAAFATVAVPLASAQTYYPYSNGYYQPYNQGFNPAGHYTYQNGTASWTSSNTYSYTTSYTNSYPTYSNYNYGYQYPQYNSYPSYSYQYSYQYQYPQNNGYNYNGYNNYNSGYSYGANCYSPINGGPVFSAYGRFIYDSNGVVHWANESC